MKEIVNRDQGDLHQIEVNRAHAVEVKEIEDRLTVRVVNVLGQLRCRKASISLYFSFICLKT